LLTALPNNPKFYSITAER